MVVAENDDQSKHTISPNTKKWQAQLSSGFDALMAFASSELDRSRRKSSEHEKEHHDSQVSFQSLKKQLLKYTSMKGRHPGNKICQIAVTQATGYDFGNCQTF